MRDRANSTALPYAVATLGMALFSVMDAVMKLLVIYPADLASPLRERDDQDCSRKTPTKST